MTENNTYQKNPKKGAQPTQKHTKIVKNRKYQSEQYFPAERQNTKTFLRKNQYQSFVCTKTIQFKKIPKKARNPPRNIQKS